MSTIINERCTGRSRIDGYYENARRSIRMCYNIGNSNSRFEWTFSL